jgi:hypothetical protein
LAAYVDDSVCAAVLVAVLVSPVGEWEAVALGVPVPLWDAVVVGVWDAV